MAYSTFARYRCYVLYFPVTYCRFLSLLLLGCVADGFDDWLAANGYTRAKIRSACCRLWRLRLDAVQLRSLPTWPNRFPASRAHRRGPLVYHRWGRHTVNLRSLGFSFESFAGASGTPQRDSDLRNSRQDLHQALRQTLGIRSAR